MNGIKEREFVAWDGEGITDEPGTQQRYVLFGASTGDRLKGHDLGTAELLDLLLAVKKAHPRSVFVGFATDYDVNMILRDMPHQFVRQLWEAGKTVWGGYKLRYFPHKFFGVSRKGQPAVILFDIFTFFGTSFVRALADYRIGTQAERDFIAHGKSRRDTFRDRDLDSDIVPYWEAELRLSVALCETLRRLLHTAGIHLAKWHGPGAVASALLTRHGIKQHVNYTRNDEVIRASANAYAGGRFECFRQGRFVGTVYQYDIRSAYPDILRRLPALKGASWEPGRYAGNVDDWSLYHCAYYEGPVGSQIGVPHWRYRTGNVAYPLSGESTWIYGVTLRTMLRLGWRVEISRVLRLNRGQGPSPFSFIESLYKARQVWKAQGNQAQWAAKLGMNSVYGKLAQTVTEGNIPPFHCLEWAGMITAAVRASIAEACYMAGPGLIACETDSVFTTVPLPSLTLSDNLGDWEESIHDEIIYLQSGIYFLDGSAGKAKTRGINGGMLHYETVLDWTRDPNSVVLTVPHHRFHGMGTGLNNGLWCVWMDDDKTLNPLGLASKRFHHPGICEACREGMSFYDGLHETIVNPTAGKGPSKSHKIPWLTDDGILV